MTKQEKQKLRSLFDELLDAADEHTGSATVIHLTGVLKTQIRRVRMHKNKTSVKNTPADITALTHDEMLSRIIKRTGKTTFHYKELCRELKSEYRCTIRFVQSTSDGLLTHLLSIRRLIKSVDEEHPKRWMKYLLFPHVNEPKSTYHK